ncbi:MAG: GTP-binding protein [Rhizobiaceae bacterium]|nr:GTP-binding protein [Rhizobiaceae bacterium]
MQDARTPVVLLTGFLGSGKTTLLNAWLRSPKLGDAAVIVNEFGDIGIDSDLIAASDDRTVELTTGCLCCTVSGDLVETLRDLYARRLRGEVKHFNRVVIETTGLADPIPVLQTLMAFPVAREYRLARVVTAVEAPQGGTTLDRYRESVRQVAVADEIVVTKLDLVRSGAETLECRLREMNPGARLWRATLADTPDLVDAFTSDAHDLKSGTTAVDAWLNDAKLEGGSHDHAPASHGNHHHPHHHEDVTTFSLTFDEPLHWEHVSAWLDALVIAHGEDLLRVKGIFEIVGRDEPIVLQAVQKLFHPPFALEAWPQDRRASRVVFITRGISESFAREVLDTLRKRTPRQLEMAK